MIDEEEGKKADVRMIPELEDMEFSDHDDEGMFDKEEGK